MSFIHSSTVSKPLIVLVTTFLMLRLVPLWEGMYREVSLWYTLPFVVLLDDVIQYWYHRKAHEWKWLWNLHRPHHSGADMGVLVTFRENIFYVMLIPNIWFLAVMTYLGMGVAVALGLIMKYIVVIGAHSDLKWDRWLYQHKYLHPLAWVIEHTISTPCYPFCPSWKDRKRRY